MKFFSYFFSRKTKSRHNLAGVNSHKVCAFLEEGCELEGKLSFSGIVRLNGKFKGEIESNDLLIVGDDAQVDADIKVGSTIVSGNVHGNICAHDRVEINKNGKFSGQITSPSLITQDGAQISGNLNVVQGS